MYAKSFITRVSFKCGQYMNLNHLLPGIWLVALICISPAHAVIDNDVKLQGYANERIMYWAETTPTYTVKYKVSFDGGQNWGKTGLELPISQHVRIQRLLMHPTQPDSIFAGTSIGIYVSGNGGDNWEKVYSNLDVWNMEFKPGNPDIIYVGSAQGFYKSEDAGKSFRKVYSGV